MTEFYVLHGWHCEIAGEDVVSLARVYAIAEASLTKKQQPISDQNQIKSKIIIYRAYI